MFKKVLVFEEEKEAYKDFNQDFLHKPFEDDFSKQEMRYLMNWFTGYLKGFMQTALKFYQGDYARSLDYCFLLYGYKDNTFFLDEYDNDEDFRRARAVFEEQQDIPFNAVKPYVVLSENSLYRN